MSYEDHKKWVKKNPEKRKAHRIVSNAVRRGDARALPCYCGSKKTQAHHEDYSQPRTVIWLCKKHHMKADKDLRKGIKLPAEIQRAIIPMAIKKIRPKVINTLHRLHNIQAGDRILTMQDIVDNLRKKPRATYTLTDVETFGLIPWARNGRTIRKLIAADFDGGNLLNAAVTGDASQRRYLLPAKGIIKYLLTYGPALMTKVRKPKQHGHTKRHKKGRGK